MAEASKGACIPDVIDAAFVPEETSKNPVIKALTSVGNALIKGREHIIPERAENVITQAETVIMFAAAVRIAEGTAEESGVLMSGVVIWYASSVFG